jgi:hypothetical protein
MHGFLLALLLSQPLAPAPARPESTKSLKPGPETTAVSRPDSAAKTAAKPYDSHAIGEEVITGEAEVKINDTKIWFPPQIDPFSPVNSLLTPETYVLDDALYRSVDSMTIPHHFIHSSYLRVPVERDFIYGDIMVFLPSFESRVATWELVVANSLGETVRRVTGKGQPPAILSWDGKTDNAEAIATGEVYSFTFNAYDAQGNQTRIPGQPQRINGMVYNQRDEWVVAIAADQVFAGDGPQLQEQAAERLDEAANIVKEKFKKEVVVYVYSEQEKLSSERCRIMKSELGRRVVLPAEALKVAPRFIPGLQPKFSKVEIHIM